MKTGLRKKMVSNTIANYIKLILNFIIAIFLTRLLFMGLSREEYGMWALLWTIFGYSVLLDFGFGTAVQKATSETVVTKKWDEYNRLISTVFLNYLFLAIIISTLTILFSNYIQLIFKFNSSDPGQILYYKKVFLIFGIGTSLGFPFGFTMEMLLGLHEIKIRNIIQICTRFLNFVVLYVIVSAGYSILEMAIATISLNMVANAVQSYVCFKKIPTLKIRFQYYDFKIMKQTMQFSLFAYIIIFSNMIIFRTDQLVISVFSTVSWVAIYQISSRLSETFKQFSTQFLDNLRPVAAALFISNQESKLASILVESNRLLGFIASLLIIPLLVYIKPILSIWLELTNPAGSLSAIILLISMYIYVFFRSSSVHILLMTENHKKLTRVAIFECIANLLISIFLIRYIGIVGVALGTLIPNVFAAIFFNIPAGCKFASISLSEFFKQTVFRTLWIGLVTTALVIGLKFIYYPQTLFHLLISFVIAGIFYLVIYFNFGLYGWERKQFKAFLKQKVGKK